MKVASAVIGLLAVAFGFAQFLLLLGVIGPGLVGQGEPGATSEPLGGLGVFWRVSVLLCAAVFAFVVAAYCFASAFGRLTRPPGERGSPTERFAKRWLWRPANLAAGLLALAVWAYKLNQWRSPAGPPDGWGEAVAVAQVFVWGGVAWHFLGSAAFSGWRRAGAAPAGEA